MVDAVLVAFERVFEVLDVRPMITERSDLSFTALRDTVGMVTQDDTKFALV